ncbi:MAG: Bacterial rane flanked domain protein [Marmoricola sp.]|nr:Bacterial rane flanked domain protein [Marmoricola sp.]
MAINKKFLNEGENVVFSTRTHVKVLAVPALLLVVLAGGGGYLSGQVSGSHKNTLLEVIWGIAVVLALVFCLVPFLKWLASTYTVTDRRLTTHTGVLARTGHDIQLARISDVSYEKGIVDRILGCGTLVIKDASELGVRLPDVPHVEQKQKVLSGLLYQGSKSDDGS